MDEIFTYIRLENDRERVIVNCFMDGVRMPARKLSAEDSEFIGQGPYTQSQKLWAARMAYRKEALQNQRVDNLQVRQDKQGRYWVRCRIDGVQQLSSEMSAEEANSFRRGLVTQRELAMHHYSSVLQNDRGQVLDRSERMGRTLSLKHKI